MLGLFNDLIEKLKVGECAGREAIGDRIRVLSEKLRKDSIFEECVHPDDIKKCYDTFYSNSDMHVGHYFRTLYNIIKYVDQSDLPSDDEKKMYTNLVRAQLSSPELELLYFNCLHPVGEKFKPLVERYTLLKHLDREFRKHYLSENFYNISAFGIGETSC